MKKLILFSYLLGAAILVNAQEKDFTKLTGPYLGQKPPGTTPEIFAPGLISTSKNELNCVFTPDGKEVYFSEWNNGINTIMTLKQIEGRWSKRKAADFSGKYSDVDPYITADGQKLFFSSMRPLNNEGESKDSDIWYVEKLENGNWSNPIHMANPNSQGKDDYYTSISNNGNLYFSIFESPGSTGDIYRSIFRNGQYSKPEKIEYGISTEFNEHDPFIAPDESYIVFSSDRPGGFGKNDIYISFRKKNGAWTPPQNMGNRVNSKGYDFCPVISHDGEYMFFTKNINGNGDIYWVSAKIIEGLRPKE